MENELILAQYKDAVDKSSIFSKTDEKGIITYVNDLFCQISGYTKEELIGKSHSILRHPDMSASLYKSMWETISKGNVWNGVIKNKKKDNSSYYVNATIYPIKDANNKIIEYISIRQDISEIVKNKQLLEIYSTDAITNLPNRQKLVHYLKSNTKELMCIVIDIHDMNLINELYGELTGNDILIQTSKQLQEYIYNDKATLYKGPSDQFVIIVEEKSLFEKYRSLVEFTFLAEENFVVNDIIVSFHIGISYGTDNLLNNSTLAVKVAKKRSIGFYIYDNSLESKQIHIENLKKLNTFKDALEDNRVEPFFQPIVNATTGELVKYESLARIMDREGNIVEVKDFLDLARKSSFFNHFTRQIIQKSFALSTALNKEVSINLAYENINSTELVNYIEQRLKMHTGPTITFEILESEEIENYAILEKFIAMAKSYGSLIAIDDFGSGYSNFTHLMKLDIDFIKIDGSIICKLPTDEKSKMLLSVIIDYAKMANIKTIAEFVSTQEIADIVKEAGIDLIQGYLYGKAQKASSLID